MAVATLVMAVVGLVISVISLTWQVIQHSLTGSRVRAELLLGGLGFGGVVTGPFDMDRSVLASQGVSEWVVAIQMRNRGRMPVDVGSFEVEFESGGAYNRAGWYVNPNLPYRLEPGSSQSFYVPLADVEKALEVMNRGRMVRGRVGLGDGRTVYTARVTVP